MSRPLLKSRNYDKGIDEMRIFTMKGRRQACVYFVVGGAAFAFGIVLGTAREPAHPDFSFAQRTKREYKMDGKTMTRLDFYEVPNTNYRVFDRNLADALERGGFWKTRAGSLSRILYGFDFVGGPGTAREAYGANGQYAVFDSRGPDFYLCYSRRVTGVEEVYGWLRMHV
jgi:hypothetical protein